MGCLSAPNPPTSGGRQAHFSVESRARLQAHTSLDKTARGVMIGIVGHNSSLRRNNPRADALKSMLGSNAH